MFSSYILPRGITHNLNQLTKQLHTSVKLLIAKDSSSSDSLDSDSENKDKQDKKNVDSNNKNDKFNELLMSLTIASKSNYSNSDTKGKRNIIHENFKKKLKSNDSNSNKRKQDIKHMNHNVTNINLKHLLISWNTELKSNDLNSDKDKQDIKNVDPDLTNNNLEKLFTSSTTEIREIDSKDIKYTIGPKNIENNKIEYTLEERLMMAGKQISTAVENKNIESELLNNISNMKIINKDISENYNRRPSTLLSNVKYLKIQKHTIDTTDPEIYSSSDIEIKNSTMDRIKFFKNLSINNKINESVVKLSTWDLIKEKELKLQTIFSPKNVFQELIKWTEQGKLWKFPIDNEQGIEEKVHFSEHIFLERHLKDWCPKKGPLRHFMELVCVGLSKNPYMTVEEKIGHITWYKNYFEDKRLMLEKLKIFETTENSTSKNLNQVEPLN